MAETANHKQIHHMSFRHGAEEQKNVESIARCKKSEQRTYKSSKKATTTGNGSASVSITTVLALRLDEIG